MYSGGAHEGHKTETTMRQVHNVHGLLIEAKVQGHKKQFSAQSLLVTLTTALTLLALSSKFTDSVLAYGLEDSDKYNILKFQPTQHFKELRALQRAQKQEMQDKGKSYDEKDSKPTPTGDWLSDLFEEFKDEHYSTKLEEIDAFLSKESKKTLAVDKSNSWLMDTLAVMIRHEQRLNRMDGMDENNLGKSSSDRSAKFYRAWESHYWMRKGWGERTFNAIRRTLDSQSSLDSQNRYTPLEVEPND